MSGLKIPSQLRASTCAKKRPFNGNLPITGKFLPSPSAFGARSGCWTREHVRSFSTIYCSSAYSPWFKKSILLLIYSRGPRLPSRFPLPRNLSFVWNEEGQSRMSQCPYHVAPCYLTPRRALAVRTNHIGCSANLSPYGLRNRKRHRLLQVTF